LKHYFVERERERERERLHTCVDAKRRRIIGRQLEKEKIHL